MANTPQAKKRIRRNDRRAEINGNRISRIRTFVKKVEAALALPAVMSMKRPPSMSDSTTGCGMASKIRRSWRSLAAIAREKPVPVYFIGVGEQLDELETFKAREFAQALLG